MGIIANTISDATENENAPGQVYLSKGAFLFADIARLRA